MTTFALPQNKTSIMLVLLMAFVLNFTCGAAHVAFHHDSYHGHRHEQGGGEDHEEHPGHSSHSAQEHEPEMLLSRARLLPDHEFAQPVVPFIAMAVEEEPELRQSAVPNDLPCPAPSWIRPPGSLRGPPVLS